jgi:3-oxoacyl-[acyl-carrier protein] reductase
MPDGRVVWVTGASRGIGRSIALACARSGWRTVLVARAASHLEETAALIREEGGPDPIVMDYDIGDAAQVGNAFSRFHKTGLTLGALVNNAGVMMDAVIGMVSSQQIEQVFSTNVFAMLYHTQYAARLMSRGKRGSIVNIASIIGRVGNAGQIVYGASKAAVIGATLSGAKELAAQNIRVNAIAPGFIDTDMVKQLSADKFEERVASIGMGRIGTPDDVARAVHFLVSDDSAYITGQILGVDGGMIV